MSLPTSHWPSPNVLAGLDGAVVAATPDGVAAGAADAAIVSVTRGPGMIRMTGGRVAPMTTPTPRPMTAVAPHAATTAVRRQRGRATAPCDGSGGGCGGM